MSQTAKREINILLLGETGAGKSTTLNALANYFRYSSFEDALANLSNFSEVVHSKFSLADPATGEPRVIESGPRDAQLAALTAVGESATKVPVAYTANFGDNLLRLIDTPGIGDTGGSAQDKQNLDALFTLLSQYQQLHAVLFFVKGTETRKTTFLKYCITELLANLHKSISNNIYFCFTFSRNSMYGPGEGFTTMRSLLEEDFRQQVKLQLKPGENCFFIDNEAYRFLVAKKQGFPFNALQEEQFKLSWNKSIPQINDLFEHILAQEPYNLFSTLSLNSVRRDIIELVQPMVQMENTISENIANIERKGRELANTEGSVEELRKRLHFEVVDLKMRQLPYSSTVCTATKCIEVVNSQIHYKTVCCENCNCLFVQPYMTNQLMLCICQCMAFSFSDVSFFCRKCGCPWSVHMHISCEYYKVRRSVLDPNVLAGIHTKKDAIRVIESSISSMQELVNAYRNELHEIQDIGSKFGYILSSNAQFSHSRFFEQYLDFLIEEERKKSNPNAESLLHLKQAHSDRLRQLNQSIERHQQPPVPLEQVPELRNLLLNLPHHGGTFRNILDVNRNAQAQQARQVDRPMFNAGWGNVVQNGIGMLLSKYILKK